MQSGHHRWAQIYSMEEKLLRGDIFRNNPLRETFIVPTSRRYNTVCWGHAVTTLVRMLLYGKAVIIRMDIKRRLHISLIMRHITFIPTYVREHTSTSYVRMDIQKTNKRAGMADVHLSIPGLL